MLKRVFINGKKVPVPVPVRTLGEALRWVEQTLVPSGHTITRICLDQRVLGDLVLEPEHLARSLSEATNLEVQIDSPTELAIQTLDALHSLASVVQGGLKPLAVRCWQSRPGDKPAEVDGVVSDLELLLDLITHVGDLAEPLRIDVTHLQALGGHLRRATVGLDMARSNSDWKAAARLLLNKLEPLFADLLAEAETLQVRILTVGPASAVAPTGSGGR